MGEVGRIGAQQRPGRAVVYTRAPAVDRRRYDGRLPMRWLVLTLAAVLALPASAVAQVEWARDYEQAPGRLQEGERRPRRAEVQGSARSQAGAEAVAQCELLLARLQAVHPGFLPGRDLRPPGPPQAGAGIPGAGAPRRARETGGQGELRPGHVQPSARSRRADAAGVERSAEPAGADRQSAGDTTPPRTQQPPPATTTATPINPVTPTPSNNTGVAVTPTPVRPPPTTAEPAWLAGFRRAMDAARLSLRQRRYSEARNSLAAATGVPLDAARREEAEALRREIDSAQNVAASQVVERARQAIRRKDATAAAAEVASLRDLSPGHVAIGELTRGINSLIAGLDRTARLATAERTGVKLFLSGQYKQAADILEQAVEPEPDVAARPPVPRQQPWRPGAAGAAGPAAGPRRRRPQALRAREARRRHAGGGRALHLAQHPAAAQEQLTPAFDVLEAQHGRHRERLHRLGAIESDVELKLLEHDAAAEGVVHLVSPSRVEHRVRLNGGPRSGCGDRGRARGRRERRLRTAATRGS